MARGGIRTVYKITASGRTEFRTLLHGQFAEEGPVSQTLYGALLFLHLCDLSVVEDRVRQRIARLDDLIEKLGPIRKQLKSEISTGGEHLLRHIEKQRLLDRDWLKGLLTDIRARRVRDVRHPEQLGRGAKDGLRIDCAAERDCYCWLSGKRTISPSSSSVTLI